LSNTFPALGRSVSICSIVLETLIDRSSAAIS
jgi:hypothetical protein